MTDPLIVDPADGPLLDVLLSLNNDHAAELSWLDADRLKRLVQQAFSATEIGEGRAFLLALDETADYDSPNFLWFKGRLSRFIYVDRIVVSPSARGDGLARLLYLDLFERAHVAGHDRVVCEVNTDPPNPASDRFHAKLGFEEVGTATLSGGKVVRYFTRLLKKEPWRA